MPVTVRTSSIRDILNFVYNLNGGKYMVPDHRTDFAPQKEHN